MKLPFGFSDSDSESFICNGTTRVSAFICLEKLNEWFLTNIIDNKEKKFLFALKFPKNKK